MSIDEPVFVLEMDEHFPSMAACARRFNVPTQVICSVIMGRVNSYKGMHIFTKDVKLQNKYARYFENVDRVDGARLIDGKYSIYWRDFLMDSISVSRLVEKNNQAQYKKELKPIMEKYGIASVEEFRCMMHIARLEKQYLELMVIDNYLDIYPNITYGEIAFALGISCRTVTYRIKNYEKTASEWYFMHGKIKEGVNYANMIQFNENDW